MPKLYTAEEVSQLLKKKIKADGLNQAGLAKMLKCSESFVSNMIHMRNPSGKLMKYLNLVRVVRYMDRNEAKKLGEKLFDNRGTWESDEAARPVVDSDREAA
jgi:ribosome-binding protein aMBF1 (putative translation factor)